MREEFRANIPWSLLWDPSMRRAWDVLYELVIRNTGWVWPVMFSVGALLFTPMSQLVQDPLLWRSFSPSDPLMQYMHAVNGSWADFSNHHTLNLMAEAGLCFGLAFWFARSQHTTVWRWGLLASYGATLTWSIHEGLWWVVYAALWKPDLIVFSGFGELLTFTLLVMTPVLGLYAPKRFLLWMGAFQAVWVLAGFPITESYKGQTALYSDLGANAWEVASWVWACAGFYWLERDGLLGWCEKVKHIALHGQDLATNL